MVQYACDRCDQTTTQLPGIEVMHTCRGPKGYDRPQWKAMEEMPVGGDDE